jgi:Domain of unknown function (DUF5658)
MKINLRVKETNKDKYFYLLLTILVVLVVADGLITRFIINNRLGAEANVFLQSWVQSDSILIIKLVGSVLAALILWRLYLRNHKTGWILTSFFASAYFLIIIWNFIVIYVMRAAG